MNNLWDVMARIAGDIEWPVLIIGGVLLYIVERPKSLLMLLWIGFGLFITAGLGPTAALIVWAPLATFGVAMMMLPSLIQKLPKGPAVARNPRAPLYWGLGCLAVVGAFMVTCLAAP